MARPSDPEFRMQPLEPLTLPCDGVHLIEASAGTGKTYTIATLYLRLLLERDLLVSEILVVTFTEAATEELRDRIRRRLREALAVLEGAPGASGADALLAELMALQAEPAQAAERLRYALTCIDEAAIYTIHGFCQRMLQDNAFESGALFSTEFITDEGPLVGEVVRDFWRRSFYGDSPGLASLARATWGSPAGLLKAVRPYLNTPELRILPELRAEDCDAAAYRRAWEEVAGMWPACREAVTTLLCTDKALSRNDKTYRPDRLEAALEALQDFLGAAPIDFHLPPLFELFTVAKLEASVSDAKRRKGAAAPSHRFFDACEGLAEVCRKQVWWLTAQAIRYGKEELARRKRQTGVMSFDDLLTQLRAALDGPHGEALAVRIAGRFPVALIDEFQDTDPAQYRIFAAIYRGREGRGLYMIGDPKQAIYSFRGADVFTYMLAKDQTGEQARYTLGRNWRSATRLVEAVNTLFAGDRPFIYAGEIDFEAVEAAGQADEQPLTIDGATGAPLQAWVMAADKVIPNNQAHPELSAAVAEETVRLLGLAGEGRALIGDRAVQPRDIAVLVRNRHEADAIKRALQARGVPSVYYSRDSVYASEEAKELLHLLLAVAEPTNERLLRAALATALVGMSASALDALVRDEIAWEELVLTMQDYHQRWASGGFMAMFRRLLHGQGIARRLLVSADGERRLTNLLHLGELLQAASRDCHGIENLLRWYQEQCAAPNGESEEQQLRLESDEDLVKIVTIHKSKGLEYPIVFLPFLWGTRITSRDGPLLFHGPPPARALTLDLAASEEHYALAEQERLAEDLRLAYVALTRAKHRCYFAWGTFRNAECSALAWLLHATAETDSVAALARTVAGLDGAALQARLQALADEASGCIAVAAPPTPGAARYAPPRAAAGPLKARAARRVLSWDWRVTSFSGLTSGRFEALERPDYGSAREDVEGVDGAAVFELPKGARAGKFVHLLLEQLDFAAARGEMLAAEVRRQRLRHAYPEALQAPLEALVANVLDTALDEADTLRLRDLSGARRRNELEFLYPLAPLTADALERVIHGLGAYQPDTPALAFSRVGGMMRGFIDLVFEHQGRYYLADYKFSYLGGSVEHYRPAGLRAAVAAHRYDLQYLIYTVALHRYLSRRLPDYDYARHFGGVYYLFLRGMRPALGAAAGVYHERPEQRLIEALDALFAGRRDAA